MQIGRVVASKLPSGCTAVGEVEFVSVDDGCARVCCASLASAWQTTAANYQHGLAKHSPTCLTTREAQRWPLKAMRS